MYNVAYHNVTNRTISSQPGYWDAYGNSGSGNKYQYFYAFTSATEYPYIDTGYCCSRGEAGYNCHEYIMANTTAAQRNSATSGLGTPRFFRMPYYITKYTDYGKCYYYYRDMQYQATDPGSSNISNKQVYVKYRPK